MTADDAIAQFNRRAREGHWIQYCDPENAFVLEDCEKLATLWLSARGTNAIPTRDALTARALKPFLPRLVLVEMEQRAPPVLRFRLVGTVITQTLEERTGQRFDHEKTTEEQRERWTQSCLLTLELGRPLRFPMRIQRAIVGEMLAMPLAGEKGEPRFVLAYGRYEPSRDWSVRERDLSLAL